MVKYTEFFWAWTNKEKIYQGRFNGKIGKQKKTNKQTWTTTNIQDKNQQPKWNSTENKQIGCFGLQNLTVLKFKELRARIILCRCMRNYHKQVNGILLSNRFWLKFKRKKVCCNISTSTLDICLWNNKTSLNAICF